MKNLKILLTFFILISFVELKAQNINKGEAFLNTNFGAAKVGGVDRTDNGKTPFSLSFGGGFGIPVSNHLFIIGRATYINSSDAQIFLEDYPYGDFEITNNLVPASLTFSQLIFNTGLQYNFYINDEFTLGLIGGITYALIDQEVFLMNGEPVSQINNEGVFGYFAGANVEKNFEDSNFSAFGEAMYNFTKRDAVYFNRTFSGMNFTVGMRYYLGG